MTPALQAKFNLMGSVKRNISQKEAFSRTQTFKAVLSKFIFLLT